ncbi:PIN domain-containing protein [Parasediminibacterium sp. JCM 36343]|uniref:PIN domain-containing protein n=1 Tax=Parasediminibacterium sp. JCM 36343 TaxID=3374279 RepID=UPI00397A97C2
MNIINNKVSAFFVVGFTSIADIVKGSLNKQQQQKISKQIKFFHIIHIDEEISEIALQLISTYHLSYDAAINDSLLPATALKYNCLLATCNTKQYAYIPSLQLFQHTVKPQRKRLSGG